MPRSAKWGRLAPDFCAFWGHFQRPNRDIFSVRSEQSPPKSASQFARVGCSIHAPVAQISGHELARQEASLIVNDFGGGAAGTGGAKGPADEVADARHGGTIVADGPSSASQTAMGGHCSVNGTPTRKPLAQTLPPEIERRDRDIMWRDAHVPRVSRCAYSGKTPETVRKTRPRLLPVEIGQPAWRWGESGANRSRPLDAAIAPRRPPRELAGVRETGLD